MSDFNIDDPIEFFELAEGFTAKDLKRAYTRKIKKYKPEKFPEEFMQIRAAYEELESDLAYNIVSDSTLSKLTVEASQEPLADDNSSEGEVVNVPQVKSFSEMFEDLSADSLADVFESLQMKDDKTCREELFCLLLSEHLNGAETFFDEFIAFGRKHKGETLACQFMSAVLKEDISIEIVEKIMPSLAEFLDGFYYNSESLLQKVLLDRGFEEFEAILSKCEERMSFSEKNDAPVFYCRLICRYFFRLPRDWVVEKIHFVNEHLSFDSDYLDEKLNYIDHLVEFAESLSTYPESADKIKADLLNGIQIYCERPGLEAEIYFYKLMKKFREADYLLQKTAYESPYIAPAFRLISDISEEYKYSRGMDKYEHDSTLSIFKFLKGLNAGKKSWLPQLMSFINFAQTASKVVLYMSLGFVCYFLVFIVGGLFVDMSSDEAMGLLTLGSLVLASFGALFPYRKAWPKCEALFSKWAVQVTMKQYYHYLRKPLIDFMIQNIISENEMTKCLHTYESTNVQCSYIQVGIREDYAVSLASIAAEHRC